jgi:hypothetical protein
MKLIVKSDHVVSKTLNVTQHTQANCYLFQTIVKYFIPSKISTLVLMKAYVLCASAMKDILTHRKFKSYKEKCQM